MGNFSRNDVAKPKNDARYAPNSQHVHGEVPETHKITSFAGAFEAETYWLKYIKDILFILSESEAKRYVFQVKKGIFFIKRGDQDGKCRVFPNFSEVGEIGFCQDGLKKEENAYVFLCENVD